MSEKPISFSTPLVVKILARLKHETRRPATPTVGGYRERCRVGDILWIKETYGIMPDGDLVYKATYPDAAHVGEPPPKWKTSRFMAKVQARDIRLNVISVTLENLQDITFEGICREGFTEEVWGAWDEMRFSSKEQIIERAIKIFSQTWNGIYEGPQSWEGNPKVWVIRWS
jgi:hypothetical protein